IDFYGEPWQFEVDNLTTGLVFQVDFEINTRTSYNIKIPIASGELEEFETMLLSLNPTSTVTLEIGSILKLRTLFNVTKVPSGYGYEDLLGPSYADSVSYQIIDGTTTVQSGVFFDEDKYVGRHQVNVETENLEINTIYIIKIKAQKFGYVLPPEITMSLLLLENDLILNQSQNDDSPQSTYWQEMVNMSIIPYGKNSEAFTIQNNIDNIINATTFRFSLPDISTDWNLSYITFNLYNIEWNALPNDINITLELNDYGIYNVFNTSNHNGHNYTLGSWTGIELSLDKRSPTNNNTFEFTIGGTFYGTIDVLADATYIRDGLNVQYSRFNITDTISLLAAAEGWAINNITFDIYNCYNTSNWSLIDPFSDLKLNITTNDGIKYSLDSGSTGSGMLSIDDLIIYPINNQFLFTVENQPDIIFDVLIKVEYIQEFYKNQYLEVLNISNSVSGLSNGGTFHVSVTKDDWEVGQLKLLITGISDGIDYFLPSERSMTLTIGGTPYSISDVAPGQGEVSLESLVKNTIYTGFINTLQPTIFNLSFIEDYSRMVIYRTKGEVSYSILENPSVSGIVNYYEDLECYLQIINTSLLTAEDYTVRFTVDKEHYSTSTKDLELFVLNRLTLLNGSTGFFRKVENIYFQDQINFTFVYTDTFDGTRISDLTSNSYIWEKYDNEGKVVDSGYGTLISTVNNFYILDFNTENLTVGDYLLLITIGKDNYELKNAMISLTVNKRIIEYSLTYNSRIITNKINVEQGKTALLEIQLTDPTQGDISLNNATITVEIGGIIYSIEDLGDGDYRFYFPTGKFNTFFSSKTLTGIINISKENYYSIEFTITIVVGMEEIFLGIPTFYFILIASAIIAVAGSLVGYRVYRNAKIPEFVKKVKSIKKAIMDNKSIAESLLYPSKEVYVGTQVMDIWEKLDLSVENIFGITAIKKSSKQARKISDSVKRREIRPVGLVFMQWNIRVGTEILAKYPEETEISEKTLMQLYSAHEYSGEKGIITLTSGLLNILSYYTGPDTGYYLILILKTEDDPDIYEGGMADISRILLDNLEDDSFIYMFPSLFQRLSLYPSLNDEELLALTYQDEIKRMIIDSLRENGVISRSELTIWLRDRYHEGFFDLEATLLDLIKKDIIKQVSVKGLESELIVLTHDFFMLRVPPEKFLKEPVNYGLPTQFVKDYLSTVKQFFQTYHPTNDDNLNIVKILVNPEVYEILRLLRTAIATRQDLEKLKVKGVDDIYGALKLLYDNQIIKVFRDEKGNEYYALLTDFYMDLIFPKYILKAITSAYEQKSISKKALIEYLKILEDSYLNLKNQDKIKKP
ncbi:MAG: hypothetical protein ACFFA3_20570, partial [Promethearchaeota archaeon]